MSHDNVTHSLACIPFRHAETSSRTFSQVILTPIGPVFLNLVWSPYQYNGKAICSNCREKATRSSIERGFRGADGEVESEKNSSSPIVKSE